MSTVAATEAPVRKKRMRAFGLPLLTRELIEQSARRRTYILRVLYACLFYVSVGLIWYENYAYRVQGGPLDILGTGDDLFQIVLVLQFVGVYLFLPAMACSVLTSEKERNTISLLLLTRLGPWTIVVEKLLSRLMPMLFFVLLSVPLVVFSYALGGLTQSLLWGGLWTLAVTAFQIAALAVMCSAYCRTTAAAFISTYVIGFLVIFFMPITDELRLIPWRDIFQACLNTFLGPGGVQMVSGRGLGVRLPEEWLWMFFGPVLVLDVSPWGLSRSISTWIIRTTPLFLSGCAFLVLARVFVVRRAFAPRKNYVMRLFRAFDRVLKDVNDKIGFGIVIVKGTTALPDFDPVAWRETTKTTLGTLRYLIRLLIVIEAPVVFFMALLIAVDADSEPLILLVFLFWLLAALLVTVKSASLIPSERSRETLDVLLTTPLSARDIVRQKLRGVWRLAAVLFVVYATLIAGEAMLKQITVWETMGFRGRSIAQELGMSEYNRQPVIDGVVLYVVCSVLSFFVYIPLITYLSLLLGLYLRTQTRAIMASVVAIAAWCAVPILIPLCIDEFIFPEHSWGADSPLHFLFLLTPAAIIAVNEFDDLYHLAQMPWLAITFNFAFYGSITLILRQVCLTDAARLLKRNEDAKRPVAALYRVGDRPGDGDLVGDPV